MGGRSGGSALGSMAGSPKDAAVSALKTAGPKVGGKTGIAGILADKKKMAGIADGLGMVQQQMQPEAAPAAMAPMDMGGGAAMANGDPSALAALAARRPDIFARIGRFNGGGM